MNTTTPHDEKTPLTAIAWAKRLHAAFSRPNSQALALAEQALQEWPHEAELLNLAALAALLEGKPERCLRYQKRLRKWFIPQPADFLLEALALAQQKQQVRALHLLKRHRLDNYHTALSWFIGSYELRGWFQQWFQHILMAGSAINKASSNNKTRKNSGKKPSKPPVSTLSAKTEAVSGPATEAQPEYPELARVEAHIPLRFELTNTDSIQLEQTPQPDAGHWFQLRREFAGLSLFQGFDELLCLPQLHNIETYWYQVEAVRKVLKLFRGRVLLADEVGLGKTVEAGMVLKEYMLRGMVENVLILTPASLVGQWQEELASKFDIDCASSYDNLVRSDPDAFWAQPRVIASIATARRPEHRQRLLERNYDIVIVDEAHHLKNRTSQNYKLVDGLQKRFLLLLSATPVQNSLLELYNLLTLLKPGVVKTQQEFRGRYMTPGKPRTPANRDSLQELMRDVMIRNTRALVDVRLPPRHASTLRLAAADDERECYAALDQLVQQVHGEGNNRERLALHHLLGAAGSSPAAAALALQRFAERRKEKQAQSEWQALARRYAAIGSGAKEQVLLELLARNPDEKKMVFVHHSATLDHLDQLLQAHGIVFARFEGSLSGPAKDAAIERFRDQVPVLLSTESGGEGRNVQFCNTLINFDLPWNPMAIEQRIGRIHRIGQQREVFIFNLVAEDTLESRVLQILDEKINMFELVVGEIDAILGELDEQQDFAELVFNAWVATTAGERESTFAELGERMANAKNRYETVKVLDEELFGEEFETA